MPDVPGSFVVGEAWRVAELAPAVLAHLANDPLGVLARTEAWLHAHGVIQTYLPGPTGWEILTLQTVA
jgi:hypothetical protein